MRVTVPHPNTPPQRLYPHVERTPYAVSLFSGGGGSTLGVERAGYTIVASIDKDADSCATLQANGYPSLHADIRTFDFSMFHGIDLVEGGPPCQPFSQAGLQLGSDDPRDCIPDFVRAVTEIRPRVFVMENVKALTFWTHEVYLWDTIDSFPDDYHIEYRVLNAADYGVPQRRQRLFVVGRRDGKPQWPVQTHFRDGVNGNRWVSMAEGCGWGFEDQPSYTVTVGHGANGAFNAKARLALAGWAREHQLSEIKLRHNSAERDCPRREDGSLITRDEFRDYYLRFPLDLPAPVISTQSSHWVWECEGEPDIRTTIAQRGALQGFPEHWEFVGSQTSQSRQVGNACPPQLIEAVVRANQ